MAWKVKQTRRFGRVYKKLHTNVVSVIDEEIARIAVNPDLGTKKKGNLAELWVYKFHCLGQLYLLGYTKEEELRLIYLEAVGSHENFYRDLKN